ncbi:FtsL-like putative cell division protein [Marinoscillum sp.]|uniref:FtsL-like putative cell division protein n=1 Tax=Marinoscillum sp. TaxID=2024838 RepID=UPI003BAB9D39
MATNTFKIPGRKTSRGGGFFSLLDKVLPMDESIADVIHVRFLPQILFVAVLCVIYIGSRHYAEKKIRNIDKLETAVEDLRADYITLKFDYMYASKQSEVAKKAAKLGLKESDVSPYKIVVEEK